MTRARHRPPLETDAQGAREDRQTILFLGGVLVGIALMGLLAFVGRWLG